MGLVRRENNHAPICAGFDGGLDAVSLGDLGSYLVHVWLSRGCGAIATRASGK
jgi:hypothetical protein